MDLHLRVLKEPRGFIRVVQCVMSIFAFSTTAGYSDTASFSMPCGSENPSTNIFNITISFGYPFRKIEFTRPLECQELYKLTYAYNFASSAEFFVATGVLAFLFTLGITTVYVVMTKMYNTNQLIPISDLGATALLTLFWLAGSSAWAQGVSDTKYYTNVNNFIRRLECEGQQKMCEPIRHANYASLNVSLIFGFANVALWAASMWFVYKETVFHKQREQAMQPPQQAPMPPQSQSPPSGVQSPEAYKY